MKLQFLDLKRQYDKIRKEVRLSIDDVCESQRFINGPVVERFEENFADFCGTKYAVGCSSGTDALIMSLTAMNIGKGDEVITTPFTFFATLEAIIRVGADPVLVDIDRDSFNIDPLRIRNHITKKTKAIIPVHIFGQCSNMDAITKIADEHNLFVVEDAAQAVGAKWKNIRAGALGDVGCFSFFPSKNLGAFGDAGIVTTSDQQLYEKMLRTRQHGIDAANPYFYNHIGGNFRLDAIQAAVLDVKLKYIVEWQTMRRNNADYYNLMIKNAIPPLVKERAYHVYNQYVIRHSNRDKLKKHLLEAGVPTAIYYPHPLHLQPCVKNLGYKKGDFPVCEQICSDVLALPIYPELSHEEQKIVVEEMAKI